MAYTAEYWEYDARLLRRWNTDPIEYEWQSTYACFNNNPIFFADPLGLEGGGGPNKDGKGGDSSIPPSSGRPESDHKNTAYKQEDGTINVYTEGNIAHTQGGWEMNSVRITLETSKTAELNYAMSPEGMSEYHERQAEIYKDKIFSTEDGLSKYLNHSILALFGGRQELQKIENRVVAGGEIVARTIADNHPAIGTYNLVSYHAGGGNDIYGDEQNFFTAHLGIIGILPGDEAARPVIRVLSSSDEIADAARTSSRFVTTADGTVHDLKPTLDRITRGERFPHRNDGSIFHNRPPRGQTEPLLPVKPQGYYREYVHPAPGSNSPGVMRIVTGGAGEIWFTVDHYSSFILIR